MSQYIDLSNDGIILGQGSSTFSKIWSTAANSLSLEGATSGTACKLSGVDQPAADTDAANRLHVQQYVQSQIRGLQLKQSAQLCSKVPVSLVAAPDPKVLRWLGPWTSSTSSLTTLVNLQSVQDMNGNSFVSSNYSGSRSIGWTFSLQVPAGDGNNGGMNIGTSDATDTINNFSSGPFSANKGQFDFNPRLSTGVEYCVLYTYDASTQLNSMRIALASAPTVPLVDSTSKSVVTWTGVPLGSRGASTTLTSLQLYSISSMTYKNVVLADRVLTLEQAFGSTAFQPVPPGWISTGIDGVTSFTAGMRILLTAQANAKENGLWQVDQTVSSLVRPADFAVGASAAANFVMIDGPGAANDDQGYLCTTLPGQDVVGTHNLTWVQYTSTGGKIGSLQLAGGAITDASGQISLVNNNLVTSGTIQASAQTVGTLALASGSVYDSSGTLSLQNNNLTTTGQLRPASVKTGALTVAAGSIVDTSGTINLGATKLQTTNTVQASEFLVPSDRRLKINVSPLDLLMEDLHKLVPSRFTWALTGEEDVGVIAQDVQTVLPEAVHENDSYLSVAYDKLVPACIQWLQLLHARVSALEQPPEVPPPEAAPEAAP